MRPTVTGFLAGSFIPFAYGVQWMANDFAYNAEMSKLVPGIAACGTGTLGAFALLLVVGPACGVLGAMVAGSISAITHKHRSK